MLGVSAGSGATVDLGRVLTHEGDLIIKHQVLATLQLLHTPGLHALIVMIAGVRICQTDPSNITGTTIGELCAALARKLRCSHQLQ